MQGTGIINAFVRPRATEMTVVSRRGPGCGLRSCDQRAMIPQAAPVAIISNRTLSSCFQRLPKWRNHISISLCLLFVLFVLATSRKSTNSGKYHLLEKRNPFYFLAYFFLLFGYFLYFSAYFLHKFYLYFTFFLTFTCTLPVYFFHKPGR